MKLYLKPILLSGGLPEDPDDPGGDDPFHPAVGSQIGVPEDGDEGGTRSVNSSRALKAGEVFNTMSAEEPIIDILSDAEAIVPDVVPSIEIPTVDIPLG